MRFQLFWKLSQIFLLILSVEKADADYQNRSDAFNNPSKGMTLIRISKFEDHFI